MQERLEKLINTPIIAFILGYFIGVTYALCIFK